MTKLDCRRCGSPIPLPAEATLVATTIVACPNCGARYSRRADRRPRPPSLRHSERSDPCDRPARPCALVVAIRDADPGAGVALDPLSTGGGRLGALSHPPIHRAWRDGRSLRGGGSRAAPDGGAQDGPSPRRDARGRHRALQARDLSRPQGDPRQRLPDLRRRLSRATGRHVGHLSHHGAPRGRDAFASHPASGDPLARRELCRSPAR